MPKTFSYVVIANNVELKDKLAKGLYTPHVIEPSAGVDRLMLALIAQAFNEEEVTDEKGNKETRVVMKFHPRIAPIKVGVFPLLKNRPELVAKALEVKRLLQPREGGVQRSPRPAPDDRGARSSAAPPRRGLLSQAGRGGRANPAAPSRAAIEGSR